MTRYAKKLRRVLDDTRPWAEKEKKWQIMQRLRRPPQSRMIVVEE